MCQDRAEADSPMLFLDPVPSPLLILILRVMFSSGPVVVVVVVVVVAVVVVVMMGTMMMMGEAPWLAGPCARVPSSFAGSSRLLFSVGAFIR